ncbi:linear amide C-N hydrolase [Paracoccus marinaquae]|uniref:linear amide C-N hydrolase n=1 Tax=Paracoccus marinaquae TaxID=2841926 RepID=UPI001C08D7BC|nr:choloylglycine hydrolase family protein [Paracoccus marinaquae]
MRRVAVAALAIAVASQSALACTGIILRADDGAVVQGRTMEFGFDIQSDIIAVPAGTNIEMLVLNKDVTGFSFEAKYGFAGANGLDMPIVFDGMNTEGLYFGAFYFAGPAVFADLTEENRDQAVSSDELGNWILGQFATVAEVREALPKITVVGTYIDAIKGFAPFHYAVTDASGASIVIEYTKDGLAVHDNTVNALTNNPPFDWHLTNLRSYIGLSFENRDEITIGRETLRPFGQGTGMAGLPGDFTSPSRFVRAVAFANTAQPSADAAEAVFRSFHILNAFDIPMGAIQEQNPDGQVLKDYTIWTSASDTRNAVYFFKSYKSQVVESIDIRQVVKDIDKVSVIPMSSEFRVLNRTSDKWSGFQGQPSDPAVSRRLRNRPSIPAL